MATNLTLSTLDNKHVIIDVGMTYTKCGFAKDAVPMHIIPTPLPLVQTLRESLDTVSMFRLIIIG